MENVHILTKKERDWVLNIIHSLLESTHDLTKNEKREVYKERMHNLSKGITEETWTYHYDIPKSEMAIMKSLWEKLQ